MQLYNREPKTLEIPFDHDKEMACKAFTQLRNMSCVRGRLMSDGMHEVRDKLILNLAKLLLGEEWDCEILC
jgi:hypothetical protein